MRFRSFGSFPSFTGYIGGLSFMRTLAYGVASSLMPRKPKGFSRERQRAIKAKMVELGILPRPGQKKTYPVPTPIHKVYTPIVRHDPVSRPTPTVPPDILPRRVVKKTIPRVVVQPRSVCVSPRQPQPAAVSNTGGLRGSLATRGRRR